MNPKIISEEPINMAELKSEIDKIKKRDGELNFRAGKTEDYLNQNVVIKKTAAKEIVTKLNELAIPRIKDIHIHKIIDIMPGTTEELKSLLTGYTISLSADNLKKIIDVLDDYLPNKKN